MSILHQNPFSLFMMIYVDTQLIQVHPKRSHDVTGIVGNRKDPSPPLDLRFDTVTFKKFHQIFTEKTMKSPVEKPAVGAIHGNKIIDILDIGQVAAGFTADQNFLSRSLGPLKKKHICTRLGRSAGRHHPAGAGADNDDAPFFIFPDKTIVQF